MYVWMELLPETSMLVAVRLSGRCIPRTMRLTTNTLKNRIGTMAMTGISAWDLDLSGHNHRHRCPSCEEYTWHEGLISECDLSKTIVCEHCSYESCKEEVLSDLIHDQ